MRISAVQMSPGADKAANLAAADALIRACVAADRPDLIALPEMWTCLGGDRDIKRGAAERLPAPGADQPAGKAYCFLRDAARAHGIAIHAGSIGEVEAPDGPLFNTSLVFDRQGRELARYRKIHLFDITTPDGEGYRESALYGAGNRVVTCQVEGLTLGLAICYDLRFAELFLALRDAGAELIILPAAFTMQTGRDHWEPLLRARAIETQCWIAAPATTGRHFEIKRSGPLERHTYGHSLICDPWGHVISRASDGVGWASARLDRSLIERIRADMPVQDHRRAATTRLTSRRAPAVPPAPLSA